MRGRVGYSSTISVLDDAQFFTDLLEQFQHASHLFVSVCGHIAGAKQ
jgi:hypothetical protein